MKLSPGDSIRKINGKRRIAVAFVAAVGFLVVVYFAISLVIGSGVRSVSAAALREQPGDRVAAIMAYADSSTQSLRERNRAVWALGQLGDSRALSVLEKYYTGQPCDHDRALCQQELKKAIKLCRGGTNLSAFVWRRGSLRS
jgi:hypothetical protein